jgi:photosystem II stability/assembly factor-like uncharacterized protein
MKKIIALFTTLFLVLFLSNVTAQYVWQTQISPVNSNLVSVSFVDNNNGWIATQDGIILSTDDAGMNWNSINQIENITPTKIFFRNSDLGWLTGKYNGIVDSSIIYRTTNSGTTWEPMFQSSHFGLNDIFFINDTLGWTTGSELSESDTTSLIMHSIDGGDNWTMPWGPRVQNELHGIHFRDVNNGQACGQDGLFFFTNNGGLNESVGWGENIAISNYQKDLYGIFNAGPINGCAVGEGGFVLFTKDNWANHLDNYTTSEDTLLAVSGLPDGSRFWAVGKNGSVVSIRYALFMLLISEEQRITSNDLSDICAVDDKHIWAVGENGTILFYNDNHPPVAVDDEVTIQQDSTTMIFVLDNDTDLDNDDLRIYSFIEGEHGSVTQSFEDNYLLFDPEYEFIGKDTLQYLVTDDAGGFDTGSVYIDIIEADHGPFEQIITNFDSVAFGNAIWGDVDNDMDYDIVICGEKGNGTKITSYYINNEGVFEKAPVLLEGLSPRNDNAMAFTDLNNDGYLDFIITGENNDGLAVTNLYIYDPEFVFQKYETDIPGVVDGSVDWGDYDNDGDLDLLISGENTVTGEICGIYRNDGLSDVHQKWKFADLHSSFLPLKESVARFVDFNTDDYLDVIAMGTDHYHEIKGLYYINNEGLFESGQLKGHNNGSGDFCDFDADGNIEVFVTGDTSFAGPNPVSRLLKYDQGAFVEIDTDIDNVSLSSADWGDFDNDGDYDLLMTGMNSQLAYITRIYENINNSMVNSGISLPGMASGTARWGDYDNDRDLDILLSGYFSSSPNRVTVIHKNTQEIQNQSPSAPENIHVDQNGTVATISWDEATDSETAASGLTYNIKLKRKHTFSSILYPSVHDNGTLKLTRFGNAFDNSVKINNLEEGALYSCFVQTVDAGFHASEWAEIDFNSSSNYFLEQDFAIPKPLILSAEWIDFDSDGALELFVAGEEPISQRLYPVTNNDLDTTYEEIDTVFFNQQVNIMDLNNDNVLDFSYGFNDSSIVIRLTGYGDTILKTGFILGSFDWGDFENDGDEDLIITGAQSNDDFSGSLFRNNNGILENYDILISGAVYGDIEWVDFDSDGDMDIALCGITGSDEYITKIYENYNGAFIDTKMDIMGLAWSDMDFADYDKDGDIDLLICGLTDNSLPRTMIYENENNRYLPVLYNLSPIIEGSCKWVDINSDSYKDIVLSGNNNTIHEPNNITKVYLWNDENYDEAATLQGFRNADIAPGDYNGDQKIDLFIAGTSGMTSRGILYKNVTNNPSTTPLQPDHITINAQGDSVKVEWKRDYYQINNPHNFTYNLRIGKTSGGSEIMSPKSNLNGKRKIIGPGNANNRTFSIITGLSPDSVYYLAVQTINASFLGSRFTDEIAFNPVSGSLIPEKKIFSDKKITNAAWIDYDSDKDLDLIVRNEKDIFSNPGIYKNTGGDIDTTLMEIETISFTNELLINDFDNDNDPDLLLFPKNMDNHNVLLKNNDGIFSIEELGLTGLLSSSSAWGDFDNDGDEDLIIMGASASGIELVTFLYKNNDGTFEEYDNLLEPVFFGDMHWVDIDNDGDKDIVRCGYTNSLHPQPEDVEFIISENVRGAFIDIKPDVPGLLFCNMDLAIMIMMVTWI